MFRTLLIITLLSATAQAAPPLKRITLEVQRADVTSVLRVFGELMHVNLVMGDDVHGQVTLRLRNVEVRQALDVVLQSQGLGVEKSGDNIYRIAPLSKLAEEATDRAKLADATRRAGKIETRLIRVNYASAADLLPQVKALLSDKGSVTVDARTNTLIVRDVDE
jgi:type IV pilus assembly protein PilQ